MSTRRAGLTPTSHSVATTIGLPVVIGLVLRCLVAMQLTVSAVFRAPQLDAQVYDAWARALAGGETFVGGAYFLAPLYPHWLGLIYRTFADGALAAVWMQHVIGVALIAVAGLAARRHGGDLAGAATAWLLALHGPFIVYENLLLAEVLGAAFLTGAVVLVAGRPVISVRRAITIGVLVGLDVLVRPTGLLIGLALLGWIALRGGVGGRRAALIALVSIVLVMAPVTIRNRVVSGSWVLVTSSGGFNLFVGNHDAADGSFVLPDGVYVVPGSVGDPTGRQAAERDAGRTLSDVEVSGYWMQRTGDAVRAAPRRTLRLFLRKVMLVWNRFEIPQVIDLRAVRAAYWSVRLPFVGAGILMPLALFGLIVGYRSTRLRGPLLVSLMTFTVATALVFVTARYRIQAVPLLAIAAGGGLAEGVRLFRRGGRMRVMSLSGLIGLVILTAPVLLGLERAGEPWLPPMNRAVRAAETGADPATVMAAFDEARRLGPDVPRVLTNRASYLVSIDRASEALADLARAVAVDPDDPVVWLGMGQAQLAAGAAPAAAQAFERALALDASLRDARLGLGRALRTAGRAGAAVEVLEVLVEQEPTVAALGELGLAFAESGAPARAAAALERAIRLEPDHAGHHYNLGLALIESGQEGADAALGRSLAIDPTNTRARLALVAVLYEAGAVDAAREQVVILLEGSPGDPRLEAILADIDSGAGQPSGDGSGNGR